MANNIHREPLFCPECSELVIAYVTGSTIHLPPHPDLSWPQRDCDFRIRVTPVSKINQ